MVRVWRRQQIVGVLRTSVLVKSEHSLVMCPTQSQYPVDNSANAVEKSLSLWKTWRKTGPEVICFPLDTILAVTFPAKDDFSHKFGLDHPQPVARSED
jgi:hypothetical protein